MASVCNVLTEFKDSIFVRPGDLHLEVRDSENFRVAEWVVEEVNELIRPDFLQFAGDNVQNASRSEYDLFSELAGKLKCPWEPMIGDHDVHGDPGAVTFQQYCGLMYKSFISMGNRFIRLNSVEYKPVGFSERQLDWLESELYRASQKKQRVIIFQHHYPYKVLEEFDGPGVSRWRKIVHSYQIEAILCGHTHYGQIANDGQNVAISTRSIGDPEGGRPGYHVFFLSGDRLACTFREFGESGPLILISSPREHILARHNEHIISKEFEIDVLVWGRSQLEIRATIDGGEKIGCPQVACARTAKNINLSRWTAIFDKSLENGAHKLCVQAISKSAVVAERKIEFFFDSTGRFTAIPRVAPWVGSTKYC